MAFLLSLSSNIAKRLLLFALSRLDLLDKDPSDFVDVAVGKRSTLELRDVGLRVKRLISLLHLQLPPQLHLTKARVALLRIILSLDPQNAGISIEVDGVQIQAELQSDPDAPQMLGRSTGKARAGTPLSPRRSPAHDRKRVSLQDDPDAGEDEQLPTAEELAKSFLAEEPVHERKELEAALQSQSQYLQDSIHSSEDEDEPAVGMGTAPTLPAFLENFITAALDRSQVVINNINVRLDVSLPPQEKDFPAAAEPSPVTLHFHVERAAVDGISTPEPQVELSSGPGSIPSVPVPNIRDGKRRMALRNICAQLVSAPDLFAASARPSRPSSPLTSRSAASSSVKDMSSSSSGLAFSRSSAGLESSEPFYAPPSPSPSSPRRVAPSSSASSTTENERSAYDPGSIHSSSSESALAASMMTTDEDRFADAGPEEEGYEYQERGIAASRLELSSSQNFPAYEDDGQLAQSVEGRFFDYAADKPLWDSREHQVQQGTRTPPLIPLEEEQSRYFEEPMTDSIFASMHSAPPAPDDGEGDLISFSNDSSELARPETPTPLTELPENTQMAASHHSLGSQHDSNSSSVGDDLAESRLYEPEEARSMYMSAYSETGTSHSGPLNIPGGWDSSSSYGGSSKGEEDAAPPTGQPTDLKTEGDDGIETPRPGSRATSAPPSPEIKQDKPLPSEDVKTPKETELPEFPPESVSKPLMSVDQVGVWFPWPLFGRNDPEEPHSAPTEVPEQSMFASSVFGTDTFHQDIPGSFSMYAERTASHRRHKSDLRADASKANLKASMHSGAHSAEARETKRSMGVEVEVGNIRVHIDVQLSMLFFRLIQRLKEAFEAPSEEKTPKVPVSTETASSPFSHVISVTSLGVVWVENVVTLQVDERYSFRNYLLPHEPPQDTILQLKARGIRFEATSVAQAFKLDGTLEKVVIGLADQNLISFDSGLRAKTSIADLKQGLGADIKLQFRKSPARTEFDLATRLININFDAQRLDDAFSCFGGFSGMLELSNSIASASTLHVPQSPIRSRPRGVHFERAPEPAAPPAGLPIKINAHIHGVNMDVRSKSCAVNLRTTAIRIIGRSEGIALTIGETRISGPHVGVIQEANAPFVAELMGTRLQFAFTPQEKHLASLLSLITPSNYRYEDDEDIIIDALLRQRKKGSVLEVKIKSARVDVLDLSKANLFTSMAEELAKLSTVAKYLPEDDRPGILTLGAIEQIALHAVINEQIGVFDVNCRDAEVAHVGLPVLLALGIGSVSVQRNKTEVLVHEVQSLESADEIPMVMARMVGDEMEPTIKVKLYNLCLEYQVSTIMAVLGLTDEASGEDILTGMAESVATITGPHSSSPDMLRRQSSASITSSTSPPAKPMPMRLDLLLRDCGLGLSPRESPSKGLIVLSDTRFLGSLPKDDGFSAKLEIRKASILLVDDVARLSDPEPTTASRRSFSALGSRQVADLCQKGYVSVSTISSAAASVTAKDSESEQGKILDIEFKDDLFLMETCADSTQTLIALLNGLAPPTPPSKDVKYQTKIMPVEDMMASFSGDAYMNAIDEGEESVLMPGLDSPEDEMLSDVDMVGSFYNPDALPTDEDIDENLLDDDLEHHIHPPPAHKMGESTLLQSFQEQHDIASSGELEFHDNYFGAEEEVEGVAHKWDSEKKQYDWRNQFKTAGSPLKLRVRDVHVIWHLFDGYDWVKTRDTIAEAVYNVEKRAEEKRQQWMTQEDDEPKIMVEEDFLFNSVWISLPVNEEKGALAKKINREIDDLVSETGSYATSMASRATARTHGGRSKKKGLRLERSRHHKISFELRGVSADVIVFPPGSGETQSSIDLRVHNFEIYDHIPSSTWNKFATAMEEPGKREMGRPQIHLELLNVKPVPTLAASELVLRVTVLPLRLHVDQDALDFITRFFEFKDDSASTSQSKGEEPFLQRIEVNTVHLKLDYKPKKVDYRSLRSGHTTEFMNFFILDEAPITLRHCIIYGVAGFDKLHKTLNDIWMPDVKRNQIPSVLSGLAPVRSLVNVGGGVRDLVVIPMREYKKDGRVVRSIQKGAVAFAKTTSSELARLGAKLAIGTQTVLQGAEEMLSPQNPDMPGASSSSSAGARHDTEWEDLSPSGSPRQSIDKRAVSNYADQPIGVMAGLRGAARSLERDLLTTRDAIIAIPAEVMESGSAGEAARAIARRAPTVILRPAIGATRALGTALLGAGNAVDRERARRRLDDKYKRR